MGPMRMTSAVFFLAVMFVVYNYLVFELVDTFLKAPRLKKVFRIPMGIVNTLIAAVLILTSKSPTVGIYIIVSLVFFIEFMIFHKDKAMSCLLCMLACLIHVMAMRALCVAVSAAIMHSTIYDIASVGDLFNLSTGISFMILNILIMILLKILPARDVRIITQHSEQLKFMVAWLSVFCVYLLINSQVYHTPDGHPILLVNQITAPVAILLGTYIVLGFAIKTGELLGYKEKTEELQHTVETERRYRTTIDKGVFRIAEINFNKGEIISGFEDYAESLGDAIYHYEKMLQFMIWATVYAEDRKEFTKYMSPLTVVKEFEAGATEISFDYRRILPEGGYAWMHVLIALARDTQSNDIKGFMQIRDIDVEKKQRIELQYKAERDLLTRLYNKSTTEALIARRLTGEGSNTSSGLLFIIDIDNFKTINDRLGHLYGDAVLSELSENLRKVFRDSDIVGRIGGDEFLVFAEGLQSENSRVKKADSICTAFLQTYANEKEEIFTVSSSVGIAVFPQDGEDFETLFQSADAALYTAKAQGKNRYSFYSGT